MINLIKDLKKPLPKKGALHDSKYAILLI